MQGIEKEKLEDFFEIDADPAAVAAFKKERDGVLMAEALQDSEKYRYDVGERPRLADFNDSPVYIVGTFKSPNASYNSWMFADIEYLQHIDDARGEASQIYVIADNVDNVQEVADAINAQSDITPKIEAQPQKAFLASRKRELEEVIAFQRIVMLVSIIVILVGVANTISMATRDRVREIGVLRAVGFERPKVVGIIVLEGMLVALIGGLIGVVGATAYLAIGRLEDTYMMMSVAMRVSPPVFAYAVLLPLVLGVLGGLPSAVSASRLPITESLRSME
ncbi:MAG: ABC transporter permease [Planctomycetota bacterium]